MMSTMKTLKFLFALTFLYCCQCMIYDKCELASVLVNQYKFDRNTIANWICLIFYGSSFDTMALNRPYGAPSKKYGLFQINNTWCFDSNSSNKTLCNINCDDLRSNDIKESVICATKIFNTAQFGAWREWKIYCKKGVNELIADCDFSE